MLFREFAVAAAGDRVAGRRIGIDVNDTDDAVAPLHGNADCLANAERHHRLRLPSRVLAGVTRQNALLAAHDVIENSPADCDSLGYLNLRPHPARDRRELARLMIDEHDAAAI